jgi:LacI family transcriptional regulator
VYLVGPPSASSNEQRLAALAAFTAEHKDVRVQRVHTGSASADGHRVAADVLGSGATGALAFNDLVAVGVIDGLRELGARVPEDISVTGFDDIPFARYVTPSLTTASVPVDLLGIGTWTRLRALIRGEDPEHDVVFSPRLEVRASTAAPRR